MKIKHVVNNDDLFEEIEEMLIQAGYKQYLVVATEIENGDEEKEGCEPLIKIANGLGLPTDITVASGLIVNAIQEMHLNPQEAVRVIEKIVEIIIRNLGIKNLEVHTVAKPDEKKLMN